MAPYLITLKEDVFDPVKGSQRHWYKMWIILNQVVQDVESVLPSLVLFGRQMLH